MFKKKRRAATAARGPMRIRVIEDDPEVAEMARRVLESDKRARFAVELIVSTEELRDELARTAFRDEASGAHSKHFFREALKYEAARARRFARDLSCLLLSLDLGAAEVGDLVVRNVARFLQKSVRAGDLVARYGEDEFGILLIEAPLDEAVNIAQRLRFGVATHSALTNGESLPMTVSIGVSGLVRGVDESPEAILDRAAAALREATDSGKNRVCVQPPQGESTDDDAPSRPFSLGQQEDTGTS
jgi:diguanylate cyclase (GGDEF)-like protein